MAENSTISIPRDVLEPIIQAHVNTAIAAALGDQSRLIEEAVSAALNTKVDNEGKVTNYTHYTTTFLQWLVRNAIRDAATKAVHEYLASDMERIKAAVAKEIRNQRSPLTKSLIEGIAKLSAETARFSVSVIVDGDKSGRY